MANKNFSQVIAADMHARLQSEDFATLFNGVYKSASEKCKECGKDTCECDKSKADDAADLNLAKEEEKTTKDHDSNDAADCSMDEDDKSDANDADDSDDEESDATTASLNEAFGHLILASEALDGIGFAKSATLSLNLANFVVEAKKKVKDKKKSKKDSKDSKKDSKKSDKKSDKGSAKKSNPFAKKKDDSKSGKSSSKSSK